MKHTYTHVKQGRDDAGNPSGIWDACVKSSTIPKALGYVGSSDNQFVAACLGDDAVKKLMAAGMPGQNYINFDDALRAEVRAAWSETFELCAAHILRHMLAATQGLLYLAGMPC